MSAIRTLATLAAAARRAADEAAAADRRQEVEDAGLAAIRAWLDDVEVDLHVCHVSVPDELTVVCDGELRLGHRARHNEIHLVIRDDDGRYVKGSPPLPSLADLADHIDLDDEMAG